MTDDLDLGSFTPPDTSLTGISSFLSQLSLLLMSLPRIPLTLLESPRLLSSCMMISFEAMFFKLLASLYFKLILSFISTNSPFLQFRSFIISVFSYISTQFFSLNSHNSFLQPSISLLSSVFVFSNLEVISTNFMFSLISWVHYYFMTRSCVSRLLWVFKALNRVYLSQFCLVVFFNIMFWDSRISMNYQSYFILWHREMLVCFNQEGMQWVWEGKGGYERGFRCCNYARAEHSQSCWALSYYLASASMISLFLISSTRLVDYCENTLIESS